MNYLEVVRRACELHFVWIRWEKFNGKLRAGRTHSRVGRAKGLALMQIASSDVQRIERPQPYARMTRFENRAGSRKGTAVQRIKPQ